MLVADLESKCVGLQVTLSAILMFVETQSARWILKGRYPDSNSRSSHGSSSWNTQFQFATFAFPGE
jgi:hypothetical protein